MIKTRFYDTVLKRHLGRDRQIAMVTGARQVGKTTTCCNLVSHYLSWDNLDHRRVIVSGPAAVAAHLGLEKLRSPKPSVVFDELHKFRGWKIFLKGFFDSYEKEVGIFVTGSSRMDVYRRGGDSLMGRYFIYRMHPFSVGEITRGGFLGSGLISPPAPISREDFKALWTHGGFPEPYLKRSESFSRRWRRLRLMQLLREDVRDTTRVQELAQIEILAEQLRSLSGKQITYKNLAETSGVSIDTVRRWLQILSSLHFGFLVRPWFRNIGRALRKEPKWYLRDWAQISDPGARAETFAACHLLKSVEGWSDLGLGDFELRYLRDKEKREVDFVVIKDGKPWFLVEVKNADESLSPSLAHFQKMCRAEHAFQVVFESPYAARDCFERRIPTVVPALTLFSQLL